MNNINSLSHSKWECKYHVVWILKCRSKVLFGQLWKNLGEVFHDLARQKDSKILEGHLHQNGYIRISQTGVMRKRPPDFG